MKSFSRLLLYIIIGLTSSALYSKSGELIYNQKCRHCHGSDGAGNGPASKLLPVKTPNWAAKRPAWMDNNKALTLKIAKMKSKGLRPKSSFDHYTSNLSGHEIAKLAIYLRQHKDLGMSLAPKKYNATYDKACAYCHGFSGNGVGAIRGFSPAPLNFRAKKIQDLSDANLLKKVKSSQKKRIKLKKKIEHMPLGLTAAEITSLVSYIQSLGK